MEKMNQSKKGLNLAQRAVLVCTAVAGSTSAMAAGEVDVLTGGTGSDWYFRAVDDAIADLFVGEIIDVL